MRRTLYLKVAFLNAMAKRWSCDRNQYWLLIYIRQQLVFSFLLGKRNTAAILLHRKTSSSFLWFDSFRTGIGNWNGFFIWCGRFLFRPRAAHAETTGKENNQIESPDDIRQSRSIGRSRVLSSILPAYSPFIYKKQNILATPCNIYYIYFAIHRFQSVAPRALPISTRNEGFDVENVPLFFSWESSRWLLSLGKPLTTIFEVKCRSSDSILFCSERSHTTLLKQYMLRLASRCDATPANRSLVITTATSSLVAGLGTLLLLYCSSTTTWWASLPIYHQENKASPCV